MKNALVKDTVREIKKSFGRFLSIFAIVGIGVAFFAGVTASSGDMKHSSDSYYDEYNMNDIRILSSIGFSTLLSQFKPVYVYVAVLPLPSVSDILLPSIS